MLRLRHLCSKSLSLAAAILLANCAPAQTPTTNPSADCSTYASVPLPAEAANISTPKIFPVCASYRSYKGIGRPVNYAEARACAWKERLAQQAQLSQNEKEPTAWVVGGSLILADIYFNGAGVPANRPVAMHFACEAEERMAKLAVEYLSDPNKLPRPAKPFEFCDYAFTTFTMNFCSNYSSEIEDDRKNRFYNSLKSSMLPDQRAAFEKLLAAKSAYIDTHSLEVYQGGTIRHMRTLGSQSILENLFRTDIVHFERHKWPALTNNQIKAAESGLRHEYQSKLQQLRDRPKDDTDDGLVTAEELSTAEKSWEAYREAFTTFARLRYPTAANVIRAKITLDRIRLIKTID